MLIGAIVVKPNGDLNLWRISTRPAINPVPMRRLMLLAAMTLAPVAQAMDFSALRATPPPQQKVMIRASGGFGVQRAQVQATVPVHRGDQNGFALTTRANWLDLAGTTSPWSNLYELEVGAIATRAFNERQIATISTTLGSASDRPFADATANIWNVTASYSYKPTEFGTLTFMLNYSDNRGFLNNIPLPGVAYTYAPSKTLRWTAGIPFSSFYIQFAGKFSLTAYVGYPWMAKAQLGYTLFGPVQVFAGADYGLATFREAGRSNPVERTYFTERKTFLGIRSPVSQTLFAELEGGYSLGRRLVTSTSFGRNPLSVQELGGGPYARLGLMAAF